MDTVSRDNRHKVSTIYFLAVALPLAIMSGYILVRGGFELELSGIVDVVFYIFSVVAGVFCLSKLSLKQPAKIVVLMLYAVFTAIGLIFYALYFGCHFFEDCI